MDDKKTIYGIYIKDKGYYVTLDPSNDRYIKSEIFKYLINDNPIGKSFHQNWGFIPEKPSKLSFYKSQPNINQRFELIDKELESEKIPLVLTVEDATFLEDGEFTWKEEFKHLQSLYKFRSDEQPKREIVVPFSLIILFELESLEGPTKVNYPIEKKRNSYVSIIGNPDVQHQKIDLIVFPSLLIHKTPCKLSSKQSFDIIREHVKRNINPKVAEITSDYDFCFEVSKIIPLTKPIEYKVNLNAFTKKKPNIITRTKTDKKIVCFEMTGENYKGYTQIESFEGKDEEDLKKNIDLYLENIMIIINTPLKTCDKCDGSGVLLNEENL